MAKATSKKPKEGNFFSQEDTAGIEAGMARWARENPDEAGHLFRDTQLSIERYKKAEAEVQELKEKAASLGAEEFHAFVEKNPPNAYTIGYLLTIHAWHYAEKSHKELTSDAGQKRHAKTQNIKDGLRRALESMKTSTKTTRAIANELLPLTKELANKAGHTFPSESAAFEFTYKTLLSFDR